MTDLEKISPKLLHKHLADDVLLSNPRKVIPSRFRSKTKEASNTNFITALESLYQVDKNNEFVLRVSENANDVASGLPRRE